MNRYLFFAAVAAFLLMQQPLHQAIAANPYMPDPAIQQYQAQQAWQHLYNSWTPRQRQLHKSITGIENAYFNQTGRHVPVTNQNVQVIMNKIGAQPNERDFVIQRMRAHENATQAIDKADRLIDSIMNDRRIWGR